MLAQYKDPLVLNKIRDALRLTDGNKTRAAKLLKLTRGQFYRALETLGWSNSDDGTVNGSVERTIVTSNGENNSNVATTDV